MPLQFIQCSKQNYYQIVKDTHTDSWCDDFIISKELLGGEFNEEFIITSHYFVIGKDPFANQINVFTNAADTFAEANIDLKKIHNLPPEKVCEYLKEKGMKEIIN